MSISIGHRAIFTVFGHRNTTPFGTAGRASSFQPAIEKQEDPSAGDTGELWCSPWEGLYLEQARPVSAADGESATSYQLDSFLASLMYGE
ncbi:MAG: hypothetical protein ABI568_02505 [Pseudarthrobacter sp.]